VDGKLCAPRINDRPTWGTGAHKKDNLRCASLRDQQVTQFGNCLGVHVLQCHGGLVLGKILAVMAYRAWFFDRAIADAGEVAEDLLVGFGNRLRTMRRKRGWSQDELAHRAGADSSYVSELENGLKEPCLRKIKQLSEALGVGIDEMVRGL
jgi:DNA-binding XRE family transcriptional regulator